MPDDTKRPEIYTYLDKKFDQVYKKFDEQEEKIDRIENQTTKTNGRASANSVKVSELEICMGSYVKPKLSDLENKNILMICIKYKWLILLVFLIGVATTTVVGIRNLKEIVEFIK